LFFSIATPSLSKFLEAFEMLKKVSFLWWQKRGTSLPTQEKAKALSYAAVAPQAAKKAKKPKVIWP